jgi:hypothetical protein
MAGASGRSSRTFDMDRGNLAIDPASTVDTRRSKCSTCVLGKLSGKIISGLECEIALGSKSTVECKALAS